MLLVVFLITFTQGLSFIALIVIASRLYSVNKEVNFLDHIANKWLPKSNVTNLVNGVNTTKLNSQSIQIHYLRQDIELLIK